MNYKEALNYIHSLQKFGSQLGLERITKLLALLDNPQDKLRFVHIAGTNGKGSTATMVSKILQQAGYKTGLYTSPFVVDFAERFQINSNMITQDEFVWCLNQVKPHIEYLNSIGQHITEFEVITAIVFLYFAKNNCDVVVLEVGLGGQYDATNVIKTPLVSVITSISLDHVEILGDTLEKIAYEKAGIIKQNGVTVTYPKQNEDAFAVLLEQCAKQNNRIIKSNENSIKILNIGADGTEFEYDGEIYKTALSGEFQAYNAVTAINVCEELVTKGFAITKEYIKKGLMKSSFAARFEVLKNNPLVILDGAHNEDGIMVLAQNLNRYNCSKICIIGMLADKNYIESVKILAPYFKEIYTVDINNPRALPSQKLAEEIEKFNKNVKSVGSQESAWKLALNSASADDMIVVCGSLYLAGDMRKIILNS